SSGWIRFAPSYFDGDEPFGAAWGVHWYAYKKVVGPSLDLDEQRQDYVVVVLDTRLGDVCGWMGSRTYSDDWDGEAYWRHVGYPGDSPPGRQRRNSANSTLTAGAGTGKSEPPTRAEACSGNRAAPSSRGGLGRVGREWSR